MAGLSLALIAGLFLWFVGQSRADAPGSIAYVTNNISDTVSTTTANTITSLVVNSANDVDDGFCTVAHCSLREAINAANALAGLDTISFNIPGPGPHTITPTSALPAITDPVIIDGSTQPGASCAAWPPTLLIELAGSNIGPAGNGLSITAGNSTVRGLVINRFPDMGINVSVNGGNIIECNFIGTDVSGTVDLGNANVGVLIANTPSNTIGGITAGARNLISGNDNIGIIIHSSDATGNQVQGNYIGTDASGTAALGNNSAGVSISDAPNNTIGGLTAGARNLISGNGSMGIVIHSNATGNQVQGNYIGTDVSGTVALGNNTGGVFTFAPNNTIGGTAAGAGNLISGNIGDGITIGLNSEGTLVQGNFIGADVSGTSDLGNMSAGVYIEPTAHNNTIGGTAAGARNLIFGNNGPGVRILGVNNTNGNAVLSNTIFANTELGIDLIDPTFGGVTPNDPGDGDTGPNNLQNFPVLTSVNSSGGNTAIQGTLNSTANATFTLQFFANSVCDPSGHGEGESLLGSDAITTNAGGNANFNITLPVSVPPGHFVTATATDPGNNTSEFSQAIQVPPPPSAIYLPIILKPEPVTYLYVESINTGGINPFEVRDPNNGNALLLSCVIGNNVTQFCGSFPAIGTYKVVAYPAKCPPKTAIFHDALPGVTVTRTVICQG